MKQDIIIGGLYTYAIIPTLFSYFVWFFLGILVYVLF